MGMLGGLTVAVLMGAPSAFAVRVADCPTSIKVESSGLRLNRPLQKILSEASYSGDPADLDPVEITAITEAVNNIAGSAGVTREWSLKVSRGGLCRYETGNRGDIEEAEFYTRNGKPTLMVQTRIGPRGILLRYYGKIESLSKTEVKLANEPVGMALAVPRFPYQSYNAGGPLVFVGKVAQLSVSVGR